ncbi:unnamed protein product [Rhizoctonia solani]|uniref:Uncharacterized protein n=1 Tax=Rhizoctonia solani TaxID=456999 RepID=A0A8H3E3B9_9AGAM|nr:unnamed protein product [Rhizoctonia solani]
MSSPPEMNPENLAEILTEITLVYESLEVTKFLGVAAATILIYDIISMLDQEVNCLNGGIHTYPLHVWVIRNCSCIGISLFYVWGSIFVMWIVTATLMVRLWIIYGKGRWFLVGIIASFLVITVPTMIFHIVSLMSSHWIPNPAPNLISACLFTPNKFAFLPYITGLFYETLLFLLTVFKTWRLGRNRMFTPLMLRLLRDGSCYYIVVLVFGLFSGLGALNRKLAGAAIGSGSIAVGNHVVYV